MTIKIVEVGLRDGLQNESTFLSTEVKCEIAKRLMSAGVQHLEVTSFVNPKWIPALADADQLMQQLPTQHTATYRALVPNRQGLTRALTTSLDEVAIFMSASETHNRKNINKSIEETFPVLAEVVTEAKAHGKPVRAYVSTVFGCPYEGEVSIGRVSSICDQLFQMGVYEISLGDTIGVATPPQVKRVLQTLSHQFPIQQLAGHFHDTRGTGLANAYIALEQGVTTLDTSFGGLGGCPYAPGAAGNLATEDLLYLLQGMGIDTGIDLTAICETSLWVESLLGKKLPSKVLQSYVGSKNLHS